MDSPAAFYRLGRRNLSLEADVFEDVGILEQERRQRQITEDFDSEPGLESAGSD
jgi:hypothetical protein